MTVTYRPGYSEIHSPLYQDGISDGIRDAERRAQDPPLDQLGPDKTKTWSAMYRRGYADGGGQP